MEDKFKIQIYFDRLGQWALYSKMQFSNKKSKVLLLGRKNKCIDTEYVASGSTVVIVRGI